MNPANRLLYSVVLGVLFSSGIRSQQPPAKDTDYDRGYYFFYYKKWDSAFLMFNRYINNPDDTLKKGKAHSFLGEIQWNIGDLYGAQQSLTDAISTLDARNEKHQEEIGYTYNMLGNVSLDLKRYDEAINFYDEAIKIFTGTDYLLEVMNGKATALQKKGIFNEAIAIYDSMLRLKPANPLLVARITDNRARTKWLKEPGYRALGEFYAALKIRSDNQNSAGLNASYAHLSDYYAKQHTDSALWYAHKMYERAKENESPDDMLEAIDKLIRLSNSSVSKEYWYAVFKQLNDSLQFSRDTTRNRFALIRYGVEKTKADNLALKFEIEQRKVDNLELQQGYTRQRFLLYALILLATFIITSLFAWYNKRRKRIKQEAENAIRESKLKTSQKVHDVVANGLYGVMNELEHNETIEMERLLNKIEWLYEKSRDISYEDTVTDNSGIDYKNHVHALLQSFSNEKTDVFIVGNEQTFWNQLTSNQKPQLQLVLNEIMVNMKKHSQATKVAIAFRLEDTTALITYKDDGIGFLSGMELGNGLKNTVSRIKSLNGEINFGKSDSGGASITISFPLHQSKA